MKNPKSWVSFGKVITDSYPTTICRNCSRIYRKIATWHVRTMYQSGKMGNITRERTAMKISVVGVCEERWTQSGKIVTDGSTFIYSEGTENKNSVGIF